MKRLLLGCDPVGDSVIWEESDFPSASGTLPISLSDELRDLLLDWNERMSRLVSTPESYQPAELAAARDRLNEEGEYLARRVEVEHGGQVQVRFLKE